MRAYVITEKIGHGVIDNFKVLEVVSNKRKAIEACENDIGEHGIWEVQNKHSGKILMPGNKRSVSYKMFYVNEGADESV